MPLTASGKVDRKAFPAPAACSKGASEGFVPPKTEIQVLLTQIWAEVLRLDEVGIEDSFFSLGGHSLLAIRAISRVNDTFHTSLSIRSLFDAPTIAEFARLVQDARSKKTRVAPPIHRASRSEGLPLSFAQERLWFLDQFAPGDVSYNVAMTVEIDGALNVTSLERSFQEIVNRHESLRTRFLAVDGKPRQIIENNVTVEMPVVDLSSVTPDQQGIQAKRLERDEARKPFDLGRAPMLRVTLLRRSEQDHVLLLTMHHIASDGWSMEVIFPELSALYESFCSNKSAVLPALPIQYADFGVWQRNWMKGEVLEEQLAYWKKQLAGAEPLELPADRPRPAVRGNVGAYLPIDIPANTLSQLRELSRKTGTTLYMTLLAAFATLLHRYSGQEDIVVGSPAAGRTKTETEHLIGFFVNTLALRTKFHSEMSFTSLLKSVKETTLDAYTHQDVPFEKLVEMLAPQRDLSRTPLFQVMFALQNAALPQLRLGEAKLKARYGDTGTSKFDLTMNLEELDGAIQGRLTYSAELFDESTISRLASNFKTLLNGIVTSPELPVASLPILDEQEKKEIVFGFNDAPHADQTSELPRDGGATLNSIFEKQVSRRPNAVALSCDGQSLTYAELNARANRIAHKLIECGVKPDTLVGLCVDRNNDVVIGILGILKAGGAYLPMDLAYPADRLAFMMEDAQAPVMLTQRSLLARLPLTSAKVICLDDVLAEPAQEGEESNLASAAGPDNLAYVIYTSGTTGTPKGSLITHRNVVRLFPATEQWYGFNNRDVWTLFHSSAFDFSVWEIWGALLYGGHVVVVPYLVSRSPEAFYDLLACERVTVLNQTPSAFRQLIQAEESVGQKQLALRYVIFGGEALEMRSLRPWFDRHGDQTPKLVNMYGITETTVHVTYRALSKDDVDAGSVIGVPIPDLQIYILDSHQQLVPVGVPGEMYVGGAGLARGYLRRPDLTNERFVPDRLTGQNGARLYRTGDLARFLHGRDIEYLGRVDQQVKIRGFRIELGEIESVLCEQPEIREAAVVARDVFGAKGLVAYLVADAPYPEVSAVRDRIKKKLPDYMVPNAFVFLERMPLTASGKIDRKALPAPEKQAREGSGQYVAPQSAVELTIADVWQRLFGTDRVSIEENFFDLGGHSLLMIQLHSRLKKALNKEFSIVALFEHPTIRSLARHLSDGDTDGHANGDNRHERAQKQKQSRDQSRSKALKRIK
jgi:amino acid adenylation domain-containing protein